jgi:hypothetical protein
MDYDSYLEQNQNPEDKVVCKKCGNDTFRVYVTVSIDDVRLYCSKCREFIP